jgi:ferredoxin-thioredoxin reductase catalytic chain
MDEKELINLWQNFTKNKDFKLNTDFEIVEMISKGVLLNEKKVGLKNCPCRLTFNDPIKDLELLCPCNFKTHNTWNTKNRCWCGLFIKA